MSLPNSGPISLSGVRGVLGITGSVSLGSPSTRELAERGPNQSISLSQLRGKSGYRTVNLPDSNHQGTFNLRSYYDTLHNDFMGEIEFILSSNVARLWGTNAGQDFAVDSGNWPSQVNHVWLSVFSNCRIMGAGGPGGNANSSNNNSGANGGGRGRHALRWRVSGGIKTLTGTIGGGGGGGGGAGTRAACPIASDRHGARGGGGGQGSVGGARGIASGNSSANGNDGTPNAPGNSPNNYNNNSGCGNNNANAGNGGSLGSAGQAGNANSNGKYGNPSRSNGGAGGNLVVKNSVNSFTIPSGLSGNRAFGNIANA